MNNIRQLETDKTKIKNGMYFRYNDLFYIKIGMKCVSFDPSYNNQIYFEDIKKDQIQGIYKSNGTALLKKDCDKDESMMNLDPDSNEKPRCMGIIEFRSIYCHDEIEIFDDELIVLFSKFIY